MSEMNLCEKHKSECFLCLLASEIGIGIFLPRIKEKFPTAKVRFENGRWVISCEIEKGSTWYWYFDSLPELLSRLGEIANEKRP